MTIDRRDLLRREVAVDGPRRRGRSRGRTALIPRLMIATLAVSAAIGQPATAQSVAVPAFTLPPSSQLSPQALGVLMRMKAETAPKAIAGDLVQQRSFYQQWNDRRLAEMRRHFATNEHRQEIAGVPVAIVEPASGIAADNAQRVLINVHGGAFLWGSGSGALIEAIPIAAMMKVRVVTLDYRLAPEHRYPAASEDVAAVYRALLKTHRPENIGIYGCSAGGIITAQATAWIRKIGLPRPGAIGTFCGTGAPYSGDSPYLAGPITGGETLPTPMLPATLPTPYMADVPGSDPIAYPLQSDAEVRAMPPTLLLAGGRDFAVSALTRAHRRLTAAGVPSELQLFDGLPHAFFMWPDMPESTEAFHLIASFFDRHLGRKSR
ncbi:MULTISPECIES: alpha/beta hydrolase [Sphingomonas]|uniref:Alpha/beta hydrolase n=2 Tax=Sphingomonas paucimobilis TaxID=13689 RepID=A0A411LLV0_SPHPI|nr:MULTISPECIES: alpha/beta hydrolase fold domain-containing protein [Sphingomonas]MBQ1480935.1 alpha/beta hydrolase [Sphingomonas sp.]MCM3680067.1 alpha/beta hydrolase [Sphingomonas paucimobilis]MDG5970535.1 alpha/beta hydrolase fold domain-containing protein [Sphingomonas paucimobilis]NNG58781.1 alpha/beta hydrolase [Sphingomonas paucimobilis]QBE93306.1 alpha/beta hydrolase [Sphingomonas paucimobilis]